LRSWYWVGFASSNDTGEFTSVGVLKTTSSCSAIYCCAFNNTVGAIASICSSGVTDSACGKGYGGSTANASCELVVNVPSGCSKVFDGTSRDLSVYVFGVCTDLVISSGKQVASGNQVGLVGFINWLNSVEDFLSMLTHNTLLEIDIAFAFFGFNFLRSVIISSALFVINLILCLL